MRFRPATDADIPTLRALAEKIWRVCYPSIISVEQIEFMLQWMYSEQQIAEELARGVTWEVIEDGDGRAVGFLSLHLEEDGRVKLNKLYVLPELQGKGFGRGALDRVMELAKKLGGACVWMQVNKRNHRAIEVYRKAGFRIAEEAVFEIGGGFKMDDYLMEKAVSSTAGAGS